MLFLVDPASKVASSISTSSFIDLQLKERYDIQEWVLSTPSLLGEDLLVVSTEFDRFDRTAERLDVLAVDRKGKLIIVELKRTAVGTAAELQALRYAAFCSTFSLEDVAELFTKFLASRGESGISASDARDRIMDFVGDPSFQALDDKPRIILAAQDFPPEITATVLWLRSFEVDLRCVRLTPYVVNGQLVIDSSVLIPLPETEAFQVRRERKEVEQAPRPETTPQNADEFLEKAGQNVLPLVRRIRNWLISRPDMTEGVFKTLLSYRAASDRAWITWIELTRFEARVALPPEADTSGLEVIRVASGWPLVSVRTEADVDRVIGLLSADHGTRHLTLSPRDEWNGRDFYVSLGEGTHRTWDDCRRYGFVSAGGGRWYSGTLKNLSPGHRVFVCIPGTGYVGVGVVRDRAVPVRDFLVDVNGSAVPILEAPLKAANMGEYADDPEKSEYVVRVDWMEALPIHQAIWEKDMFANQNSACRLTHAFTRETLLERFHLAD
ncbi:MAG TPA: hypothetical protein VF615_29095 [Longimicrobiaceae bacterium]|jgi:hypothetical protein